MIPKNSIELQLDINNKMTIVIDNVATQLTEKLKDIIEQEVYSYDPSFYTRTYELENSWYASSAKILGNYVSSVISQDGKIPTHNKKLFQHGNNTHSLRNGFISLDTIVNEGRIGHAFGFPDIGARPFWDKFEQYVDTNVDRLIKIEMRKVGLYVA